MNIGLFYGTDTGNTEEAAKVIQSECDWADVDIKEITETEIDDFNAYDVIILGIPTAECGAIQVDWEEFWDLLPMINWSEKQVALYGLGDQFGYGDFFLDAMGKLFKVLVENGANMIGLWDSEGYEYEESVALIKDTDLFCGLGLDDDNEPELTPERINKWLQQLEQELAAMKAA